MIEQIPMSPFDLVNRDPVGDYIKFNDMTMPYDYKQMASAAFDQAYYFGLGAKAYQMGRRLLDTEEKIAPEILNKEFETTEFTSPMSRTLAQDFVELMAKKKDIEAIMSQGTGTFFGDTAPWFAGMVAGSVMDPTNVVAGYGAAKLTGTFMAEGIRRTVTEAAISGVATAGAYQYLAPEQGEKRSLSNFATDVAFGAMLEGAGAAIFRGSVKYAPIAYNKLKARGKTAASKVFAAAEKMFHSGKKTDIEGALDASAPSSKLSVDGEVIVKAMDDANVGQGAVFAVKNESGDVINTGFNSSNILHTSNKVSDVAPQIPTDTSMNKVVAFDLSKANSIKVTPEHSANVLKEFSGKVKEAADVDSDVPKVLAILSNAEESNIPEILSELRDSSPELYDNVIKELAGDADAIHIGNETAILRPERLEASEISPAKELFSEEQTDTGKLAGFEENLNSNKSDIEYDADAELEVKNFEENLRMEEAEYANLESTLLAEASRLESEGLLTETSVKELAELKEEKAFFSEREKVFKQFANCLIKGI